MFAKLIPLVFICSTGCMAAILPTHLTKSALAAPGIIAINNMTHSRQEADASSPGRTVEELSAKSGDWTEPSMDSEEKYVTAMRLWLDSLEPFKRERARAILKEAHPYLEDLREAIRGKKAQLASLSFDRDTSPETLPRLGMELQKLKASLRDRLRQISNRLRFEAGVDTGPVQSESFWLTPISQ